MMKDEREKEQGLRGSFGRWLDAKAEEKKLLAEQRRRLDAMASYAQGYFEWGAQVFEALNDLGDTIVMKPATLSQVVTNEMLSVSTPGQFVYHIDVIGNQKEVVMKLRKRLAELRGMTLEMFVSLVTVKVVGNNVILVKKV